MHKNVKKNYYKERKIKKSFKMSRKNNQKGK